MSRPDATAAAALDAQVIRPAFFAFLDIDGAPHRVTTAGYDVPITGTGDADLDGFTFMGINADVIDISEVKVGEGGSETVTARISGLMEIDADTLNIVGDRTNWQGRPARLWRLIRDASGASQGGFQHYYTGYMTALAIRATVSDGQAIELAIEGYISAFSQPSGRSYLDQELFDAGDLSARAAIAIANGTSGNPLVNNTPVGYLVPTRGGGHFFGEFGRNIA